MQHDVWTPLNDELDRWQTAGKRADFWLRDDDAVEPTAALARLLDLSRRHAIPVALAVIPEETDEALARYLDDAPLASVAVHGWSHTNFAGHDEKKQELGLHRQIETITFELKAGFERLQNLHASRFTPVLVPPWNRIAAPLIPGLAGLGFRALSVFGPEKSAPLPLINSHVDLMDWHGTRGGREPDALIPDIVKRLGEMHETGGAMGFLSHHLVHDAAAWAFLDALFERTNRHPACRWMSLPDLLERL